jgi:hypothetical protein
MFKNGEKYRKIINNMANPKTTNLPFGDALYHQFMVILGMV